MKKRTIGLITCALCALALTLGLIGCGGTSQADKREPFVGYWECISGTTDGGDLTEEDLDSFRDMGFNFIVHLAKDGTGEVDIMGDVMETTWDADKGKLDYEGDAVDIKLEDGKLRLVSEDGKTDMLFRKGSKKELAATIKADRENASNLEEDDGDDSSDDSSTDDSETTDATPLDPAVTVADDDYLTITLTEKGLDDWGDACYTAEIVNKSDKNILVYALTDRCSVDGTMTSPYLSVTLMGNTRVTKNISFSDYQSVDDLKNVTLTLRAQDDDDFEEYGTYQVNIP